MRVLPRFKEDEGAKCSHSISLVENMEALSEEDATKIAAYMESCAVIDEWLSNVKDPITKRLAIPSKTWSDGEYVWDSSHIHYLKNYRARLPSEFVAHAKKRMEMKFDPRTLDRLALRNEFEAVLVKLVAGDESFYAKY